MHRTSTRVAMAVAAVAVLSTLEVIGADAAGPNAKAAALLAQAGPVRVFQPTAIPGAQLWVNRFKCRAADVVASPDQSKVFVAGTRPRTGVTGEDYATVAYDAATGAQLWLKIYNGSADGDDATFSAAVSPDGTKVFVTGSSDMGPTGFDYATVAYDAATGARLWLKRYNSPGNGDDFAYSVAASPDGGTVFVTGGSDGDYATVAYNAATGAQQWARRYNGPGNASDTALSVAASPDRSTVFVTGFSQGISSGQDYATVAYNAATGAQRWARRYNGPGNGDDTAESLAAGPDGSTVFVTGISDGDDATVAYNAATGAQQWVQRYNGANAFSVAVSPDGTKVFVTGTSNAGFFREAYATVAYDAATGAQQWVRRYNGPGNGENAAFSVAASPDGAKVFVTGYSFGGSSRDDYATVAYDAATGAQQWVRRYNGLGNGTDTATSVAVSPVGSKVFVTGYSQFGISSTIAYSG